MIVLSRQRFLRESLNFENFDPAQKDIRGLQGFPQVARGLIFHYGSGWTTSKISKLFCVILRPNQRC